MVRKPLVSIITPSYNQGQFLEATIQSVLGQTYSNLEYILIDGGSRDESRKIIEKYADYFAYWISEPDRGQADAINKGLRKAKGDLLGWLNADDLLLSETVETVVGAFRNEPEVDVVYGRLQRINAQGDVVPTPILPKDKVTFSRQHVIGECIVNQPGSFWKRESMEKVGYLDESLRFGLDYEYWIRMAIAGVKFKRLPQTVAYFRLSQGSKTVGETEKMGLEQLKILNKILSLDDLSNHIGLTPEQIQREARKTQSSICLHIFYGYVKKRNISAARHWLYQALKYDPKILFQRRWVDLALAGISRRWMPIK